MYPFPIGAMLDSFRTDTFTAIRKAAAVGAVELYGDDRPLVVVDAGTALTVDFIEGGHFRGGNISPGVDMRLEALHQKTATLPQCQPMVLDSSDLLIGKTTEQAIVFGVMQSIFYEVKGYIDSFSEKNDNILTIFIGGDAEYFVNRIKNAIFAGRKVMYFGLNRILEYNAANEKI